MTLNPDSPIARVVYVYKVYMCKTICFCVIMEIVHFLFMQIW